MTRARGICLTFNKNLKKKAIMGENKNDKQNGNAADAQQVKQPMTNRQRLAERIKKAHPDFNTDDDEAVYGAVLDRLNKDDETDAQRKRFSEAISKSDIAPEMMSGLLSGKNADGSDFDLEEYLFDKHLDFFLDYLDEDKNGAKKKLADRRAARKQARAEDEKFKAEQDKRIKTEDAELDAAIKESGYRPEQVKDLVDWIYDGDKGFIVRASRFELKKDDFIRLFHIKDWKVKMKESEDRGYKRGKNEKIDMFAHQQRRRKQLPPDQGGGGGTPMDNEPEDETLKSLDRMKNAYTL